MMMTNNNNNNNNNMMMMMTNKNNTTTTTMTTTTTTSAATTITSTNLNPTIIMRPPKSNMTLPIRNENGMIIVFIHVPKTGGTTIRKPIETYFATAAAGGGNNGGGGRGMANIYFVCSKVDYHRITPRVTKHIQTWHTVFNNKPTKRTTTTTRTRRTQKGRLLYYELHAMDTPSYLYEFRYILHEWKLLAHQQQIPFFAFTVLRDSISFSLSYFNFYHLRPNKGFVKYYNKNKNNKNNEESQQPSVEDFMKTIQINPQCLFLARTADAYRRQDLCMMIPTKKTTTTKDPTQKKPTTTTTTTIQHQRQQQQQRQRQQQQQQQQGRPCGHTLRRGFREDECNTIYHWMYEDLDWIGRTETMDYETLPLLSTVITGKSTIIDFTEKHNNIITVAKEVVQQQPKQPPKQPPKQKLKVNTKRKYPTFVMDDILSSSLYNITMEKIYNRTLWDRTMYQRTIHDYPISMWNNFFPPTTTTIINNNNNNNNNTKQQQTTTTINIIQN